MQFFPTALTAKVHGQNEANRLLREYAPKVAGILQLFKGDKIELAAGGFTKKFKTTLDALDLPYDRGNQVTLRVSHCSLILEARTCTLIDGGTCTYQTASLYIGKISDILESVMGEDELTTTLETFRTDYSADFVLDARRELQEAKKAESAARAKLFYFGEYDN